ncbi:MAG: hypothetical protein P4L87_19795, partial [Formivibrio sp.]|nr:hypothetical protein [Formivibrio sp.]
DYRPDVGSGAGAGIYRGFKSALLGEANGCLVRVVLPVSEFRCFPVASQIKSYCGFQQNA